MFKSKKEQYDEIVAQIKDLEEHVALGQSMLDKETDPMLKLILQATLTKTRQSLKEFKSELKSLEFLKKM